MVIDRHDRDTRVVDMQIGILYSRIRKDEKLLLGELRERGHEVEKIDVRKERFGSNRRPRTSTDLDLVVDRCLSTSRSLYATQFLDSYGPRDQLPGDGRHLRGQSEELARACGGRYPDPGDGSDVHEGGRDGVDRGVRLPLRAQARRRLVGAG